MVQSLTTFPITSDVEAEEFERHLEIYVKSKTGHKPLSHYSLARIKRALEHETAGGRLFAALVDIRINVALIELHVIALGKLANSSLDLTEAKTFALTDIQSFEIRMDIHDHSNAFVFRFRSLWDKIMGLFVLRFEPDKYDTFCQAKSKKASFRKIFSSHALIGDEFVTHALSAVQAFDDRLRTSEAHGTGALRKSTFTWEDLQKSPPLYLIGYWNFLNEILHIVAGIFDKEIRRERVEEISNDLAK